MDKWDKPSALVMFLISILVLSACLGSVSKNDVIQIGYDNVSEQKIMGQMYAVLIEDKTDWNVKTKAFTKREHLFEALINNEIDLYGESSGDLYTNAKQKHGYNNPLAVTELEKKDIEIKYPLTVLKTFEANNEDTKNQDDSLINTHNLIVLNDETYANYPDVVAALQLLEGKISGDDIQAMNKLVDENGLPERKVVESFLKHKGILN